MKPMTLALVALSLALPAVAQDHSAHGAAPADTDYRQAMEKMHRDMMIEPTGNADRDFILGMIPHHEGAVAMARIVLEQGSDPEVRALAERILAAQEEEIGWMRDWLARN